VNNKKKGTTFMNRTPEKETCPGWYIAFQTAVLSQLPRPGEIDISIAMNWKNNQEILKERIAEALNPQSDKEKTLITNHVVDLGAPHKLPFEGFEIFKHEGCGEVSIELRSDDNLYMEGKRVELFLVKHNDEIRPAEDEFRHKVDGGDQINLNSNVLDYLYKYPELFPEHWKKDKDGKARRIFFWGSIFRDNTDSSLCVQFLYWSDNSLHCSNFWFSDDSSQFFRILFKY